MARVPKIVFSVNKYVNMFYHVDVLFRECFPDEILGFLENTPYTEEHEKLRTKKLHELFQALQNIHTTLEISWAYHSLTQKTQIQSRILSLEHLKR